MEVMKYSEFERDLQWSFSRYGIKTVTDDFNLYLIMDRTVIVSIPKDRTDQTIVSRMQLNKIPNKDDRWMISHLVQKLALTEPEEREEKVGKKFYWKLKGEWLNGLNYLNYKPGQFVETNSREESFGYKTKLTEREFKELADRFGFIPEAFEKEEIS